jgi:hypothetical protein
MGSFNFFFSILLYLYDRCKYKKIFSGRKGNGRICRHSRASNGLHEVFHVARLLRAKKISEKICRFQKRLYLCAVSTRRASSQCLNQAGRFIFIIAV